MPSPYYDPRRNEQENIRELLLAEIRRMPETMRESESPFVYLDALKHLIFSSVLGLYFGSEPPAKIDHELANKQLDVTLGMDPNLHHKRMTPEEFVDNLLNTILPHESFFLLIERKDWSG